MSEALARFNRLPDDEAEEVLLSCIPNPDWASRVAGGRPYRDPDGLYASADSNLLFLSDEDVLAGVASHPRIGGQGGREPAQSQQEQKGVSDAPDETRAALAAENQAYEERFGHVFLIAAAGRSADEILGELRRRMRFRPNEELVATRDELRKIMLQRLERWLNT